MADPKAAPVEAVDKVEPVAPVTDAALEQPKITDSTRAPLTTEALSTGNDIRIAPGAVAPGEVTITPREGEPIKGVVSEVGNAKLLTTANNDVYKLNTDRGGSDKGAIESITQIRSEGVPIRPKTLEVKSATYTDTINHTVAPIVKISDAGRGITIETGAARPELALAPKLELSSPLPVVNLDKSTGVPSEMPLSAVPRGLIRDLKVSNPDAITSSGNLDLTQVAPPAKRQFLENLAATYETTHLTGRALIVETKTRMMTSPDALPVVKADYTGGDNLTPMFPPRPRLTADASAGFDAYATANPNLHGKALFQSYMREQQGKYIAENGNLTGFTQKIFGDNVPGWAQRKFGEGHEFVMRDPSKMPGFDIGGADKANRNMLEFWKGIQGMKPGDNLNGLLDLMNGRMNGKDIARLGDFLMGQLGRRGGDALGMQDIMNLSKLFRGFGDRAGLGFQLGDSRSGLMMSFGLNGKFDFQIRFGALTLGFGDSRRSGLSQIGNLLFTQEGRLTQSALGTGGLRATDILSRNFTGQSGQGQWNPFGSSTGDGAIRSSTQLTARLTSGNREFISQLQDNSSKLAQQLEASKMSQMGKLPGALPGDFRPSQLDPGGKNLIQQNFDPLRQDVGKLQPGQKADGPKILTGNIEMDARAMDGMGGRRGPLTAAAHEATMKGDLLSQQGKIDQLPGAKLPGEKLTPEEEAAKKKLEEDKKKGDVRAGEQFLQDEEERKAKERREQEEEREEELEALNDADEAKRRALMLILEARKKREKELKEKALKDQIQKQEEAKRAQYRVSIGDSLENIATKQLRNPRLAALIFDVNRKLIPIKFMNGKEVAVLTVGAILSLPSVKEIKDFSQAGFTLGPKFNKVDFTVPAQSQQGKSAEDELEAMFGSNWDGAVQPNDAQMETTQNGKSQQEMDEFTKRRANIESVLGKMGPKKAADGRMRYTVRFGDTLKSIAMKHPALEDVSSWRILAEINNLSTDTDAKDNPKALVPRGSVLMIPTREEVEEHKRKMGLRKAIVLPGQNVTTGSALPALKHCPNCGNKSIHTATVCECGTEFIDDPSSSSTTGSNPAAPYVVGIENKVSQESTNSYVSGPPTKKEDRFELALKAGHIDGEHWSEIANLEPETRIVKMNSVFDPNLEFSLLLLQALVDGRWLPVAGYEMRENAAVRIDYTDPKARSSVKIDLPPSAAQDLAKNDLIKNWQNYKRKFVTVLPH
ncbi:MAG: LysM peptidoglycan-binding domain-containing protein [Cyanobacteria bacterium TGS_CYA1]|nr:LysM peptidoglycan-binding domain-containing protein [Cyanobacteria bacterium TGS_CYA1]